MDSDVDCRALAGCKSRLIWDTTQGNTYTQPFTAGKLPKRESNEIQFISWTKRDFTISDPNFSLTFNFNFAYDVVLSLVRCDV